MKTLKIVFMSSVMSILAISVYLFGKITIGDILLAAVLGLFGVGIVCMSGTVKHL